MAPGAEEAYSSQLEGGRYNTDKRPLRLVVRYSTSAELDRGRWMPSLGAPVLHGASQVKGIESRSAAFPCVAPE